MTVQFSLFFIQRFKGKILFNVPMSEHTSWKIGGPADVMAFPQDEGDLKDLIVFTETKGFASFILGAGTNLLVRDGGFRGVVINMNEGFREIEWREGGRASVGAGVRLVELLAGLKERGLSGLEFAAGIPGAIGGALIMNAGAYGSEMKDIVEGVEVMGKKGQKRVIPADEIGFAYRATDLPKHSVVVRVHMRFEEKGVEAVKERIRECTEKRRASARIGYPNAGSVFKNPEGSFAGRLIEEAGLKGARIGDAQISEAHANYIVNLGKARAKDVLALMALARDKVYSSTGVVLEPEVKVIGED